MLRWLDKRTAAAILREIGTGRRPLAHAALDELPEAKPIAHLRSILVATGALPVRDEHLARLERWITTELPAALLARLLGIHVSVAVAWQRASGGDWTSYAADIIRRATNHAHGNGVDSPADVEGA